MTTTPPIFLTCFSCLQVRPAYLRSVNICRCAFNTSRASINILNLCRTRQITPENCHSIFTNSITNENLRKMAVNMGYKKQLPYKYCSYVCAAEFGKHSGWFNGAVGAAIHKQLVEQFAIYLGNGTGTFDRKISADIIQLNILQSRRIDEWTQKVVAPNIIRPALVDDMVAGMFRVSMNLPTSGMIDMDRILGRNNAILQPTVVVDVYQPAPVTIPTTGGIRPVARVATAPVPQPPVPVPVRRTLAELQRLSEEARIGAENLRMRRNAETARKTWRNIAIDTNIIVKVEEKDVEEEQETCPICCEDITTENRVTTNCKHAMCSDCVVSVVSNCGSKCSICRGVVSKFQFGSITQLIRHMDIKINAIIS